MTGLTGHLCIWLRLIVLSYFIPTWWLADQKENYVTFTCRGYMKLLFLLEFIHQLSWFIHNQKRLTRLNQMETKQGINKEIGRGSREACSQVEQFGPLLANSTFHEMILELPLLANRAKYLAIHLVYPPPGWRTKPPEPGFKNAFRMFFSFRGCRLNAPSIQFQYTEDRCVALMLHLQMTA